MDLTLGERDAIAAHASVLGLSPDEYIHRTAAERALAWQREREAFQALARRHGQTAEKVVRRGRLTDSNL
ncbi:hypothetical protein OIE49_36175 [Streptomyces sp. NBC_01788]|uniref:hypothetical protein n=1 Tax=Streptomyces sp. NBC_01788 TaxID=2975940 RepID=UPI002DDB8294|nr:hypothetical protein [Streptomyces sp. NBC_01788]WSB30844.1 hypothetical protein OIE49_36175 [Streptomyces sp. NBC_01788]